MSLDASGQPVAAAAPAPAAAPVAPSQPAAPAAGQPVAPTINYNIAAPTAAPTPAQPATPIVPSVAPPATPPTDNLPPIIPLSADQFRQLIAAQTELNEVRTREAQQRATAEREAAEARARQGQLEDGLRDLRTQSEAQLQAERTRAAQIEQDAGRYALTGELGRALSSHNLVEGGAEQLTQLWQNQFSPVRQNGTFIVQTPALETPAQFVARQLASPQYAHFLRATNPQGGTAGAPTAHVPPAPAQPVASSATNPAANFFSGQNAPNLGQAAIEHALAQRAANPADTNGATNLKITMGLHRRG